MPVRSLHSSVLKWPAREKILEEAQQWAHALGTSDERVEKILCFGSVAEGKWGVGSDIDIAIIVHDSDKSGIRRFTDYPNPSIGVPADLLVYTVDEVQRMKKEAYGFITAFEKAIILYEKN